MSSKSNVAQDKGQLTTTKNKNANKKQQELNQSTQCTSCKD